MAKSKTTKTIKYNKPESGGFADIIRMLTQGSLVGGLLPQQKKPTKKKVTITKS